MDIFGKVLSTAEIFDPTTGNFTLTSAPMPGPRWQFTATLLNDGRVLIAGGKDEKDNYLDTALLYDPVSDSFAVSASHLSVPRAQHAATLLKDGTVLISGGFTTPAGGLAPALSSAELFDPVSNTFQPVGSMTDARGEHTATLLGNAEVMVAGGTAGLASLASAELYNPTSRSFTVTGSMANARTGAAAILLGDGRALVTGGGNASGVLKSAELYDSATGKFQPTANDMPEPHFLHSIAQLPGGDVLVAGGFAGDGIFFFLNAQAAATTFDPSTNSFTAAAPLNLSRAIIAAAVLKDGRVFIPGGVNFQGEALADAELYPNDASPGGRFAAPPVAISGGMHSERVDHRAITLGDGQILITGGINGVGAIANSAELYDPVSAHLTLTQTSMTIGRSGQTMTLLNSGKVLVAGGGTDTAEIYDPTTGSFTATAGKMSVARLHHTAALLKDGTVLIAGGVSSETTPALQSAELYDPASNSFTPIAAPMVSPRVFHVAALLPNGTVLLAGGSDSDDSSHGATNSAEIYDPVAKTFTVSANTMSAQRYGATATTLGDGSILIVDGDASTTTTASADLFDPVSGRFSPTTGAPAVARFFHSAALLGDGTVLIAGGTGAGARLASSEIYDPATETFKPGPSMVYARSEFTATALSDGNVLIAGGVGTNNFALPSTELFVP